MSAWVLTVVADPDAALVLLLVGILLIYWECNWPGRVVPGCVGLLLAMVAIDGLAHQHLNAWAFGEIGIGLGLLVVGFWYPLRWATAGMAATELAIGLRDMVVRGSVNPVVAAFVAIVFCFVSTWLVRVALAARRNKRAAEYGDGDWGVVAKIEADAAPQGRAE